MKNFVIALSIALAAAACNNAPERYLTDEIAGSGRYPWDHPTEGACAARPAEGAGQFDGFTLCALNNSVTPIDDPVMVDCSDGRGVAGDEVVFWAYDGRVARAYPIRLLQGRELVHDDWEGTPVLVDW